MTAQFGWSHISRAAVQQAEAQLANDSQGVVDELGMLEIHQGYADRFFPGTSVLHTRLRYVLFVAWAYDSLQHHRTTPRDVGRSIAEHERSLGIALKHKYGERNPDGWGLIGRRTLPRMPAQRPSMMYWSALGAWGLLHRHPDGSLPSRVELHTRLANPNSHVELHDDEGRALLRNASPFIHLPSIPSGWPDHAGIGFSLTKKEQDFLRDCLGRVNAPGSGRLSLLARLSNKRAGLRLKRDEPLLCKEICSVAGEDWPALQRANQAAGLAAITRGIYLALVEWLCTQDNLGTRDDCLKNLNTLLTVKGYRKQALVLNLDELAQDIGFKPGSGVPRLLQEVQDWLKRHENVPNHKALSPLLDPCLVQEQKLKGNRARLAPRALTRRREWWQEKIPQIPEPLHYRWYVAVNLLRDLENRDE